MISWVTIWVKSENFEVFFFYSFHFCRLINQTFFQASEWLKETHSCWVWHFCNVKKILMGLRYVWNLWIWLTLFYSFLFSVFLKHHIWNNMNDWKLLSVLSFLSFWAIWNWYLNLFPWKSIHSHFLIQISYQLNIIHTYNNPSYCL